MKLPLTVSLQLSWCLGSTRYHCITYPFVRIMPWTQWPGDGVRLNGSRANKKKCHESRPRVRKTCHVSLTLLNLLTKPKNSNYYYARNCSNHFHIPSLNKQHKKLNFQAEIFVLSLRSTGGMGAWRTELLFAILVVFVLLSESFSFRKSQLIRRG